MYCARSWSLNFVVEQNNVLEDKRLFPVSYNQTFLNEDPSIEHVQGK